MHSTLKTLQSEGRCFLNASLAQNTTMKVGGTAKILAFPEDYDQLLNIISFCDNEGIESYLFGNGSNIIVSDKGFDGIVVSTKRMNHDFSINGTKVTVGAGMMISTLALKLAELGLSGLEWAFGIPGTVGGAVFQNAGAFGGSMDQVVSNVLAVSSGTLKIFRKNDLNWGYRYSAFQNKNSIILDVSMNFKNDNPDEIKRRMKILFEKRKETQPTEPSAGSVFKKTDGFAAGFLIDQTGLKGFQIGDAKISEKHANFIVNCGAATASDVYILMNKTKEKVFEKFGIWLIPEIELLGGFDEINW